MDKINEKLTNLAINGYNKKIIDFDSKDWNKRPFSHNIWTEYRKSFQNKTNFVIISKNTLINHIKNLQNKTNELEYDNKIIRELLHNSSLESTYLLETYIYHILSSLDNLTKLVFVFYKDLNKSNSVRVLYKSILKQSDKFKDTELLKVINNEKYSWLVSKETKKGLYGYRGKIYHHISKICNSQFTRKYSNKKVKNELKIKLPKELISLKKLNEEIPIIEFVEIIWEEYEIYINDFLSALVKDLEKLNE
jgi:hypothetical protein